MFALLFEPKMHMDFQIFKNFTIICVCVPDELLIQGLCWAHQLLLNLH